MNILKLRWIAIILFISAVGGGFGAMMVSKWFLTTVRFDTIEANRLEIYNEADKPVVIVTQKDGSGGLLICNAAGEPVANFLVNAEGGGWLSIRNATGTFAAELLTDKEGDGHLLLKNAAGKTAANLVAGDSGGMLVVYDEKGELADIVSAGMRKLKRRRP